MVRNFRKPLVIVAPKTLLRLSAATSNLLEMSPGSVFHPVLDDPKARSSPKQIKTMVFVSGKHYYALDEKVSELGRNDVAIIRLEQLCPFPVRELQEIVARYSSATDILWSQEEHRNYGAWSFVKPRFENFVGRQVSRKKINMCYLTLRIYCRIAFCDLTISVLYLTLKLTTRNQNIFVFQIKYKGRGPLAAPAVGIGRVHRAEVEHILNSTFA